MARVLRAAVSLATVVVAVLCLALVLYHTPPHKRTAPFYQPNKCGQLRTSLQEVIIGAQFPSPPISTKFTGLSESDICDVEKFVIFVGYARSGHSIIGSLMDSHPDMIIAHEYMLFRKWISPGIREQLNGNRTYLFNKLYNNTRKAVNNGLRSIGSDKKGYTLHVNNSWQGEFRRLKVIGDKSGGATGILYTENADKTQQSYQEIKDTVKVPVYSLHVVRNPFDMISTRVLYIANNSSSQYKYKPPEGSKYSNSTILNNTVKKFFTHAQAIQEMISTCKLKVLEIHSEDFVMRPQESMQRICEYLGVECSPEYLQICQDKVFPNVSRTRDKVEWSEQQIEHVQQLMNTFSFFRGYNFKDNQYHH